MSPSLTCCAVIAIAAGVLAAADEEGADRVWDRLPDELQWSIGSRLASLRDLSHLSQVARGPNRLLKATLEARRQFQRLIRCLSSTGAMDGTWLDVVLDDGVVDLRHLSMPPLPASFPSDLVEFIQQTTAPFADVPTTPAVEGVRRAYPPALRGLFPHCRHVADALLLDDRFRAALRDPDLVGVLHQYGVTFHSWTYGARVQPVARDAPLFWHGHQFGPYLLWGLVLSGGGGASRVGALMARPAYRAALCDAAPGGLGLFAALHAVLPTIPAATFRQIVQLPIVGDLLTEHDPNRWSLLSAIIQHGRIGDLMGDLVDGDGLAHLIGFVQSGGLVGVGRLTPDAIVELLGLLRRAPLPSSVLAFALDSLCSWLFTNADASMLSALFLADADLRRHAVSFRTPSATTFMHKVMASGWFVLVPVLMEAAPDADFGRGRRGQTPIAALRPDDVAAFVAHLPEPKAAALRRFDRADLIGVLRDAGRVQSVALIGALDPILAVAALSGLLQDTFRKGFWSVLLRRLSVWASRPWRLIVDPSLFL